MNERDDDEDDDDERVDEGSCFASSTGESHSLTKFTLQPSLSLILYNKHILKEIAS